MADWYAIYRESDGRLESITTIVTDKLSSSLISKLLSSKPDLNNEMWDETTTDFISRPAKVLVDRLEELKVNADYSTGWGKVNLADKTSMEKAIIEMLGIERFRNQADTFEIGG